MTSRNRTAVAKDQEAIGATGVARARSNEAGLALENGLLGVGRVQDRGVKGFFWLRGGLRGRLRDRRNRPLRGVFQAQDLSPGLLKLSVFFIDNFFKFLVLFLQ